MKIITSNRAGAFNQTVLENCKQFVSAKKMVLSTQKNGGEPYHTACETCLSYFAYSCGLYKAALDSSPTSVRKEFERLDTQIKNVIKFVVSKHKEPTLAKTLFEDTFHTEDETYIQFLDYTERFTKGGNTFFKQLFGAADVIITQFALGYITGIKLLCRLCNIPYSNVPSEANCLCKNWKYFFTDSNDFTVSGTFILPQQSMNFNTSQVTEEINKDVYSKLKKRPLSDFGAKLEIIDISGFSS